MNKKTITFLMLCAIIGSVIGIVSADTTVDTTFIGVSASTPNDIYLDIGVNAGGDVFTNINGVNINSELNGIWGKLNGENDRFGSDGVARVIYNSVYYLYGEGGSESNAVLKTAYSFGLLLQPILAWMNEFRFRQIVLEEYNKDMDEEGFCFKEYEMRLQYNHTFTDMWNDEHCAKYVCVNVTTGRGDGWCKTSHSSDWTGVNYPAEYPVYTELGSPIATATE